MRGPLAENQSGQGFVLLTDFAGNPPVQPALRINGDPLGLTNTFAALAGPAEKQTNPEPSSLLLVIAGASVVSIRAAMVRKIRKLSGGTHKSCQPIGVLAEPNAKWA